jgi:hypothetical protein
LHEAYPDLEIVLLYQSWDVIKNIS